MAAPQLARRLFLPDTPSGRPGQALAVQPDGMIGWNDLPVNVKSWGAVGDGVTDDSAAIQAAINYVATRTVPGGSVTFPGGIYLHSQTISIPTGVTLVATDINPSRWLASVNPVTLKYTGNSTAISLVPTSGVISSEGIGIQHIKCDGASSGANATGLVLSATSGSSFVYGCRFEGCTFANYGLNQIALIGGAFDITFRDCTIHNSSHGTDNLIINTTNNGSPGQIVFENCWMAQSQNGKWCYYNDLLAGDVRFLDGVVTTGNSIGAINLNANGLHIRAQLTLLGTHIEACGTGLEWSATSGGNYNATILPSIVTACTTGVAIGTVAGTTSNGAYIDGSFLTNTTDILIRAGGDRGGTVIGPRLAQNTVVDQHGSIDGTYEVTYLGGTNTVAGNPPSFPGIGSTLAPNNKMSMGSGAPSKPAGLNPVAGDFYHRVDTPGTANQRLYVCTVGGGVPTWVGIA